MFSFHRKHVFLASEVFVYFILAVLDLLTHTLPTIGSSLDSFRSLDIIIGQCNRSLTFGCVLTVRLQASRPSSRFSFTPLLSTS